MKHNTHFDVLVVYSSLLASSAVSRKKGNISPFSLSEGHSDYDSAYAYFLDACKKRQVKAAFTTSADITGPGTCRSYWLHDQSGWKKIQRSGTAEVIFDKCAPLSERQRQQRDLLFSAPKIQPFNEAPLYQLFFDKHSTYAFLPESAIPTVIISDGTPSSIAAAIQQLDRLMGLHPHWPDFTDGYVLKDRHGCAGVHVYSVKHGDMEQIASILAANPQVKFVLQPMLQFDHGYSYKGLPGRTEMRLIFMGEQVVQTYIRVATANEFRCNANQGGTSIYIRLSDIPNNVLGMAYAVAERLPTHDSLYALDFVVSNAGNPYLLEGNTGPGLNWAAGNKMDEQKSKELIEMVVSELAKRVRRHAARANSAYRPLLPIAFA